MARRADAIRQGDLFEAAYPVRREPIEAMGFDARLRRAISDALKEDPRDREAIAAEMARVLGQPTFSKHMLDAYSAESRDTHNISVLRFMALVRVLRAWWLLDVLAAEVGCTLLEGEEARLAERGLLLQQIEELKRRERALAAAAPVRVARRPRR